MRRARLLLTSRYPNIIAKYAHTVDNFSIRRKLRRYIIRHPAIMYALLATLAFAIVYMIDVSSNGIITEKSEATNTVQPVFGKGFVNATTYVAAVGLLVGAFQVWLLSMTTQASSMKDFLGKLFDKPELYKAWYELFYSYSNRTFREIDIAVRLHGLTEMSQLERFNDNRELGSRYWHPRIIQYEMEEQRIDNLLGYLNIIGDYYDRGILSLSEIGDVAEFYLLAIANSEAFRAYLDLIAKDFSELVKYKSGMGYSGNRIRYGYPPFRHLCLLLHDLNERKLAREDRIYDLLYYRSRDIATIPRAR